MKWTILDTCLLLIDLRRETNGWHECYYEKRLEESGPPVRKLSIRIKSTTKAALESKMVKASGKPGVIKKKSCCDGTVECA